MTNPSPCVGTQTDTELNEKALEAAYAAFYYTHELQDRASVVLQIIQAYLSALPQPDYEAQVEAVARTIWKAHEHAKDKWFNIRAENCGHSKELAKSAIQAIKEMK